MSPRIVCCLMLLGGCYAGAQETLPAAPLQGTILLYSDENLQVFARSATLKTLPEEALEAGAAGVIELAAARNESEQVSLVIRPATPLSGVALSFSDLTGPGRLAASAWSWRRVASVPVPKPSVWYGLGGWQTGAIPDPLLPAAPFDAPAGENSSALLQIEIPKETAPGVYTGSVRLAAHDTAPCDLPVSLTVWDFVLPDEPTLDTMVCGADLRKPKLCALLRGSGVTHLKYGSTSLGIKYDKETTQFDIDWTTYEADLATLVRETGFRSVCLPPSLLGSQNKASGNYLSTGYAVGSEEFWPVYDRYMTEMAGGYRARGFQHNVTFNIMDEIQPNLSALATELGTRAQRLFPEADVLLTTHDMPDALAGAIDIWCVPWHFFATRPEDVYRWDMLRGRGLELWAYMNSLYTINARWNPGAMRLFPVALAKYGYTGALWWSTTYFKGQNPWEAAILSFEDTKRDRRHYANGQLLYPPLPGEEEWHSSLRWENYTQGIEDFEFMVLLRERWQQAARALGNPADDPAFSADQAMRWWGSLLAREFRVQTFRGDPAYIHRFRQLIANEITQLLRPPLALVDCEPGLACAVAADTLHVRGVCEAGTRVTVAGQPAGDFSDREPFVFVVNVPLALGINLIPIEMTGPGGASKTLFREILRIEAK